MSTPTPHALKAALILGVLAASAAVHAQDIPVPLLPFHTAYTHWDHHWLQWLPTHPRFEAIEASVATAPDDPGKRYLRVWLTERASPKRQVYYFDDPVMAKAQRGDSHYRPITVSLSGEAGTPQSLELAFRDDTDTPVAWQMRFEPGQALSRDYAGLKPQNDHASDAVFLLWHIGPNATTWSSEVRIGGQRHGVDRASIAEQRLHYGAAYTAGMHGGVFNYGRAQLAKTPAGISTDWGGGRAFAADPDDPRLLRSAAFGYRGANRIELRTNAARDLESLRHLYGPHSMLVEFTPPLGPRTGSGRYAIRFDRDAPVLQGRYEALDDGTALKIRWSADTPDWARSAPLESAIRRGDRQTGVLTVAKVR